MPCKKSPAFILLKDDKPNFQSFLPCYLYEFYPSVSETILQTAIRFAEDHVEVTDEKKRIIIAEIFCFSTRVNLGRKNKYHHLLSQLCIIIDKNNCGLYRE